MTLASGYPRIARDYYVEPRWCVEALLDAEDFPGQCWDASCGGGTIPRVFIARGYECDASDVEDRGYGRVEDFWSSERIVDNIISNPPYANPELYARHALNRARCKVALILRLSFLESTIRERFFRETPLARVLVSRRRISMPPGDKPHIKPQGGIVAYAWFIWKHGHNGPPVLGWF